MLGRSTCPSGGRCRRRRPSPRRRRTPAAPSGSRSRTATASRPARKADGRRRQRDHRRVRVRAPRSSCRGCPRERRSSGRRSRSRRRRPASSSVALGFWKEPLKLYQRSKLKQTASALKSVPSWNLTPWRRWNVHAVPSSLASQLSARPGATSVVPGFKRDERLEDLLDDPRRLAVGDERAVERDRVGGGAEDERAAFSAARGLASAMCRRWIRCPRRRIPPR